MKGRGVPHLQRRGNVYYFRRALPRGIRRLINRREIKVSLRTRDLAVARVRCRELTNRFEQFIGGLNTMSGVSRKKLDERIRQYFLDEWSKAEEIAELIPQDLDISREFEVEGAKEHTSLLRGRLADRAFQILEISTARSIESAETGDEGKMDTESFDYICAGVLRAQIEKCRIFVAMLEGRYEDTVPKDPLFEGLSSPGLPPMPGQPGDTPETHDLSLIKLADRYCDQKGKHVWVSKTYGENRRVLDWFIDLFGPAKLIAAIQTEDVREFRDLMLDLPTNHSKAKKFEGKTLRQIVAMAGDLPRLAPKTATKYFLNLKSFLNWCVDEGYLEKAPGAKIKVIGKSADPKDARLPFSEEQLSVIFQSPQYTGHSSITVRTKPGNQMEKDGKFWVPLIGLFSGMRLGEIVQLLVKDVREQDDVYVFDVARGEGETKQLKTASSRRLIPVHPDLERMGFLAHVEKMKNSQPKGRLFPEVKPGKDGYFSHNFSKHFSRYLRAIGAKTKKVSFHSFRHNFKDALVAGGVEDSRIRALLGHADASVTGMFEGAVVGSFRRRL